MVAIPHHITRTGFQAPAGLVSSDLARFMAHVVERSNLNHYQAYRMSRVFDEMSLALFTQQRAAFERVAEHRSTMVPDADWDEALRQWINVENRARADNSARYGADVRHLPTPRSLIAGNATAQR